MWFSSICLEECCFLFLGIAFCILPSFLLSCTNIWFSLWSARLKTFTLFLDQSIISGILYLFTFRLDFGLLDRFLLFYQLSNWIQMSYFRVFIFSALGFYYLFPFSILLFSLLPASLFFTVTITCQQSLVRMRMLPHKSLVHQI